MVAPDVDTAATRLVESIQATERSRQNKISRARGTYVPTSLAMPGEMKYIDTTLDSAAVSTTEIIQCINACQVGTTVSTRIGRQITLRSVELQGYFTATGANTGDMVRWAVVYDRQTNAAAPTWTDVFKNDVVTHAVRNHDNKRRFKVLAKQVVPIPKAGADNPVVPLEYYRKLRHPTEYNSTNGGTVADITTGGLFFMVRAMAAAGADDVALYGIARVRYADN